MNLPNRITVLRIALIPVFVLFLMLDGARAQWAAALIFVAASLTDLLDGHIARTRNLITDFGKFMDPIADKLLVMSAMVVLVGQGRLSALATIVLLAREFVISGVRLVAASKGVVIAAGPLGKYKTAAQMTGLTMIMLSVGEGAPLVPLATAAQVVLWISVALSLWSLVDYMVRNREVFGK